MDSELHIFRWKGQDYESECDEDGDDPEPDACETKQATPKAKATAKSKAKAKSAPGKVRVEMDAPFGDCAYVPGEFRKRKKAYCQECTCEGFLTYWEALQAWNFSDERAELLKNLSASELSRRRFD